MWYFRCLSTDFLAGSLFSTEALALLDDILNVLILYILLHFGITFDTIMA
jgi:hypothetical protein